MITKVFVNHFVYYAKKHKNIVSGLEINRSKQVLVSDITYVRTRANPSYLALVTDAYSEKIIEYDVSARPGRGGIAQRFGNGS
jgi:transposase InsO family protein